MTSIKTKSVLLTLGLLAFNLSFATKTMDRMIAPVYSPISLKVVSDFGREFPKYEIQSNYKEKRAYLEAKKGKRYKLKIKNLSNRRIGVVIAVDGRNIISGKKSYLKPNERMYVLEPNKTSTIKGWRTSQNKVNRFYFTNAGNSYAGAWDDYSAMGVIAATVYAEKPIFRPIPLNNKNDRIIMENSAAADTEDAGTGYGREEHSASTTVSFHPQTVASAKYFYKYQWRDTLCKQGVIACKGYKPKNRFWPYEKPRNGGYAPPPPK